MMSESCVFIRKLYFYPWALNRGKLVQYSWPPGGAHDTACSVSLLPPSLCEFLQRELPSPSSAGAAIPLQLSVPAFDTGMHEIKLHGKGETIRTRGQVGQCATGRCWEVRMWLSITLWMALFIQTVLASNFTSKIFFPLVKKIRHKMA